MPLINKRWDGSRIKTGATFRRWTGSAWKTGATVRVWTGSEWIPSLKFKFEGGDVVYSSNYGNIHVFKNTSTFKVSGRATVTYLMIGGGGAGGGRQVSYGGAGGGAGGYLTGTKELTPGTYTAHVGAGGIAFTVPYGGDSNQGAPKGEPTFLSCWPTLVADGGGGGKGPAENRAGGCGAGGTRADFGNVGEGRAPGVKVGSSIGYNGGDARQLPAGVSGGGGGGSITSVGGTFKGGSAMAIPTKFWSGSPAGTFYSRYIGGGGSGGTNYRGVVQESYGVGGASGDGISYDIMPTAGAPNTGSGGGGGFNTDKGGSGGSGLIIILYTPEP